MARPVSLPRRLAHSLSLAATLGLLASCAPGEIDPSAPAGEPTDPEQQQPLSGENLAGSNLGGSNLGGSNLAGSNLGGANLGGSNLAGSNLGGSNLGGSNLGGNNLGGSNLAGSNLGGSNLAGSNLGGSNLGGSNLAGSNLGGSNLAGSNTAGNNVAGTNLAAAGYLSGSVTGANIHNVASANGMLYSGEDKWSSKPAQCVVMGIGSTAFPKLLGQQSANAKIQVALGMLPWGFSSTRNGAMTLRAWEAIVWGDKTYCVFVLAAPPATTWAGTAGFIKAIFRWNAPPTQAMDISGIEASAGIDPTVNTAITTYTGMMNAAARFRAGTVPDDNFIAGELAFASATTNNQSVLVDFSSWVQDKNGNGLVLGNVDSATKPPYAEALYIALDNGDGTVQIVIDDAASHTPIMPTGMFNSAVDLNMAYQAYQAGVAPKPVPRRCGGALFLNAWFGEPVPAGKCDDGLSWSRGYCEAGASTWSTVSGTTAPMNAYMQLTDTGATYKRAAMSGNGCGSMKKVISETYVHMWQRSYDLPGTCTAETDVNFCRRLGRSCGSVTATDNCGNIRTVANCGACASPLTCGGGGSPNVCGNPLSVTYEAEGAGNTIAGAAFATVCEGYVKAMGTSATPTSGTCSGGQKIRYVGNSSANYVKFNNVYAPVAGTYQLMTYGVVLGSRDFYVSVNGGSGAKVTMTGPDWYTMVPAASSVVLKQGMNTIKIYNTSAYAPDMDRIVVTQPGGSACTAEPTASFCARLARNCGSVSGPDNCGTMRTVSSCGTCASGSTCGGGGAPNVCGASGGCSLVVTQNDYDGSAYWGTITIRNAGAATSDDYVVAFDLPSGAHCTNDAVPFGAKLSPLTGSGASAHTTSNHCVFTWTNATDLDSGESLTFHYSTDSTRFASASNVTVNDPVCK